MFTDDLSVAQLYKSKDREAREAWLRERGFVHEELSRKEAAKKRAREQDDGDDADDEASAIKRAMT